MQGDPRTNAEWPQRLYRLWVAASVAWIAYAGAESLLVQRAFRDWMSGDIAGRLWQITVVLGPPAIAGCALVAVRSILWGAAAPQLAWNRHVMAEIILCVWAILLVVAAVPALDALGLHAEGDMSALTLYAVLFLAPPLAICLALDAATSDTRP